MAMQSMVKAEVELPVSVSESGITVGDTIVTWGYLMENPLIRDAIKRNLCLGCDDKPTQAADWASMPSRPVGAQPYAKAPSL